MLRFGKIEVSSGFLLIIAIIFYLDDQNILPLAMLACALHELGHFAVIACMGGRVLRFRMTAVGGEMLLSSRRVFSYELELLFALAGPAANLAAALLVLNFAVKIEESAYLFAGLNLAIGAFNLLPAYPLDGGRAVKLLICILWSSTAAEHAVRILTKMTSFAMLAAGVVILWKTGRNFTVLMVSIWILFKSLRM